MRVGLGRDGRLRIDRYAPGRGAWLCRLGDSGFVRPECVAQAAKRRAFGRALRREVDPEDVEALSAMARERARMEQAARPTLVALLGAPVQDNENKERD